MSKTVFFGFKPSSGLKIDDIETLLSDYGFQGFKIVLPREPSFSGRQPSLRRGFCFIRFNKEEDVNVAIGKLDGQEFKGGKLKVQKKNGEDNAYSSDEDGSGPDYNSDECSLAFDG